MEAFAVAIEGLALAEWLRFSRWGYAALNATHILGIALLVGAVATLDLRFIGVWKSVAIADLYRVLSSVAASGLAIAVVSGFLLFSVRATEYILIELFFLKLLLILMAAVVAAVVHLQIDVEKLSQQKRRWLGGFSLILWLSVLVCGRLLAFVE